MYQLSVFLQDILVVVDYDDVLGEGTTKSWRWLTKRFGNDKIDPNQSLERKISELQASNRVTFVIYNNILRRYFKSNEIPEYLPISFQSHLSILIRLSVSIVTDFTTVKNEWKETCWLSNLKKRDSCGYVSLKCTNLVPLWKPGQGTRLYNDLPYFSKEIIGHRYVLGLMTNVKSLHAAHRCHGHTNCINPYHLKASTCKENQDDRGCKYGCRKLCPHTPSCIWTNAQGLYLPCRNDIDSNLQCFHKDNCFQ